MFQGVTVWLDNLAPAGGGFDPALAWAERLHLPLRSISLQDGGKPALLDACAEQCRLHNVPWNGAFGESLPPHEMGHYLRPNNLCVFSRALAPCVWDALVNATLANLETTALVCPKEPAPLSRPLIVNENPELTNNFLRCAARLCKALRVAPVVLTVAHYEGEAIRRERAAEDVFRTQGVPAEFDSMACADTCRAVALVARCRGCPYVFVERRPAARWRRWLHGDTLQGLLRLGLPVTYLTVPSQWLPHETEPAARAKVVRDGQDLARSSPDPRRLPCEAAMQDAPNP